MGERHSADKEVTIYSSSDTGVIVPGYIQVWYYEEDKAALDFPVNNGW